VDLAVVLAEAVVVAATVVVLLVDVVAVVTVVLIADAVVVTAVVTLAVTGVVVVAAVVAVGLASASIATRAGPEQPFSNTARRKALIVPISLRTRSTFSPVQARNARFYVRPLERNAVLRLLMLSPIRTEKSSAVATCAGDDLNDG